MIRGEFERIQKMIQAARAGALRPKVDALRSLFPKQRAFISDGSKRKAAICSRRAGKTTGTGFWLLDGLENDQIGDQAYITLTRANAKKLMFNPLKRTAEKEGIPVKTNDQDLTITSLTTGNTLYLTGAHTADEVEKLRGLKFKRIVLDEVASFRSHLSYLIDEVLEPTTIDLDGEIALIGTPSANPGENYFHKVTTGVEPGWSVHRWTILDNPFIPHAERWLKQYRERKGWTEDNLIYLREWCGKWTMDLSSLVYAYDPSINDFNPESINPTKDWVYIMGVDIGYNDAFTIAVNAFGPYSKEIFTVYQFKKGEMIVEEMAAQIKRVMGLFPISKIRADQGGLGKAICEEFRRRYHLPVEPAEKTEKPAFIELANSDLKQGLIKIKSGSDLAIEMSAHQWNPDKPNKEDDRTPNDLCDAWLYSYRDCKAYMAQKEPPSYPKDTPAYFNAQAEKMLQDDIDAFEEQQEAQIMGGLSWTNKSKTGWDWT